MKRTLEVGFVVALAAAGAALGLRLADGNWHVGIRPVIVARAQTNATPVAGTKVISLGVETMRDAVWVTKVTVGDKFLLAPYAPFRGFVPPPDQIIPGQPFPAGDDWLRDMAIYLENRTDKRIAFLSVQLGFPETGNGRTEPQWMYPIQLGRLPAVDAVDGRTGKPLPLGPNTKPLRFQPGQTLVVHVADYVARIRAAVENAVPLFYVTKCIIYGTYGCFDDGMCWGAGRFTVPDPKRPGKRLDLPVGYFPGKPHRYPPWYAKGLPR